MMRFWLMMGSLVLSQIVAAPRPHPQVSTPSEVYVGVGAKFTLSVSYLGDGKLVYRWFKDGRPISGATTNRYGKSGVTWAHSGVYAVEVTDKADGVKVIRQFFVNVAVPHGHLMAWGNNENGQTDVPAALLPPVEIHAVAAGGAHSLAISMGRVFCWGDNAAGQCDVPSWGSLTAHAVAAGEAHSLALLTDGTVRGWGDNAAGQCDVPADLGVVRAIAAGGSHSLALLHDGRIVGWGQNASGQLDVPEGLTGVLAIAAGHDHSLALLADGTVVAWGANDLGQGVVPAGLKKITSIGAAGDVSFAITSAGKVHAWGDTSFGQAPAPAKLKPVAQAAGGWDFIAGRIAGGALSVWGTGAEPFASGAKGVGKIQTMAAGGGHLLALRSGTGDAKPVIKVQPVGPATTVWDQPVELSVTAKGASPLLRYQWYFGNQPIPGATGSTYRIEKMGLNDAGRYMVRVFNGYQGFYSESVQLAPPGSIPPLGANRLTVGRQRLAVGETLRIETTASGAGELTYLWRHNGRVIAGENGPILERVITSPSNEGIYVVEVRDEARQVVMPATHVVVPPSAPVQIVAWGDNILGQTQVPQGIEDAITVAAGRDHTLVLRADGTVAAWGDNRAGQCAVPAGLVDVVAIAAHGNRSAALTAEGVAWTWGGGSVSRSVATGRNDLAGVGLTSRGLHVFSATMVSDAELKYVRLVEAGGEGVVYRMNLAGVITAHVEKPILTFASAPNSFSRAVQFSPASVVISMPDHTWSHVPSLRTSGYVYAPYSNGVAFAAVPGRVAVLTDQGVARFWETKNFFAHGIPDYGSPWTVSYPLTKQVIDDVTHLIAGGRFHAVVRQGGGVGAFGDSPEALRGVPWRLSGIKSSSAGQAHAVVLCEGPKPQAPEIVSITSGRSVAEGEPLRLRVEATGTHPRYQWIRNGEPIAGACEDVLDLGLFEAEEAGAYSVRVDDGFSTVTSTPTLFSLGARPVLSRAPITRSGLRVGERLELSATVSSPGEVNYQWLLNGLELPGENSATLVRDPVTLADAGRYTLKVTANSGEVLRAVSHVFVLPVAGTRLLHEDDVLPFPRELQSWSTLRDIVDFLPDATSPGTGLALRLDGTVARWGHELAAGPFKTWIEGLSGVVALSQRAVLLEDGSLSPRPFRTLPDELTHGPRIVELIPDERNLVFITEDGRLGVLGDYATSVSWQPTAGEPIHWGAVRYELAAGMLFPGEASSWFTHPFLTEYVVVGAEGEVATTLPRGLVSWAPGVKLRRLFSDLEGGLGGVSTDATVYAGSIYGELRETDIDLASARDVFVSERNHVRFQKDGSVRRWLRAKAGEPWTESPIPAFAGHSILKTRIAAEKVMALCDAANLVHARALASRIVVTAGAPIVLNAEVSGTGELDFMWEHNGRRIPRANTARLEFSASASRHAGWYRMRATNEAGLFDEVFFYVLVETPGARLESATSFATKDGLVKAPAPGLEHVVDFVPGLALLVDGTLAGWPSWPNARTWKTPVGLRDIVCVEQDGVRGCAIDANGRAIVWNLSSGAVEREWSGALWLRSKFVIMRDGSVRTYANGAQVMASDSVVDLAQGTWKQGWREDLHTMLVRRDGSLLTRIGTVGDLDSVQILGREQIGGAVRDMRIHFFRGYELLVEDDVGGYWHLRSGYAPQPTQLRAFVDGDLTIDSSGDLRGSNDVVLARNVIESHWPWMLLIPTDQVP